MTDRPRYSPDVPWPPYAYLPGVTPHPHRSVCEAGARAPTWPPSTTPMCRAQLIQSLRRGVDLFNHGYFWEAHEAWEEPWQREQRGSQRRLYLQALIRLAAAALKLRMAEPRGVAAHATWCATTFRALHRGAPALFEEGPDAGSLIGLAERLASGDEGLVDCGTGERPPVLETVLVLDRPAARP